MVRNSVLRNKKEVEQAIEGLASMGLYPHIDRNKSWDTYKMIRIIKGADRDSNILDVGCDFSPILPMLRTLGFKNLYGCDLRLGTRIPVGIRKLYYRIIGKREALPLLEMLEDKQSYKLSEQNLEDTNYGRNFFDFITSLSVIEHGVDLDKYFREMNRVLKPGGLLLTSTDYWKDKIRTDPHERDKIFSREEMETVLANISKYGFKLVGPMDYSFQDKVVYFKKTEKHFTFIFFILRKT